MISSPPEQGPAPATNRGAGENPFVGPEPLKRDDRLFGRLKETRELYYLLTAERIVWLHSPSGAGKTSLIWASLVPRLERDGFAVCPGIRVNLDLPQLGGAGASAAANRYLTSVMLSLSNDDAVPADYRSRDAWARQTLPDFLRDYLAVRQPTSGGNAGNAGTLLVFDQFEEILTIDPLQLEEKRAFFRILGEALRNEHLWALFALREEFLPQLEPYIDCIPTRWTNTFRLDLLGAEATREVLQRTAALGGRNFTDAAADALFKDLARVKVQQPDGSFTNETGRFVEPVQLQVVCRRLWEAMPQGDLNIDPEHLSGFGDVSQALGAYYSAAIGDIVGTNLALERRIRDWFGSRLITPSGIRGQVLRRAAETSGLYHAAVEGLTTMSGIRGRVLRGAEESEGLPNAVIEGLLSTHLIRGEQRAGATWYELAHDRLIQPILASNHAWLEAHLQPFQHSAALWVKQGRPASGGNQLLRGAGLYEALRYIQQHPSLVSADEARLVAISRAARRIRLWTQAALAVIVLLSLGFVLGAYKLLTLANQNEAEAKQNAAEAKAKEREAWYQAADNDWNNAADERDQDPLKAAHYFARAAERFAWAGHRQVADNALLALKYIVGRPLLQAAVDQGKPVAEAVLSLDGTRIVTWGRDAAARVWDRSTGEGSDPQTPVPEPRAWEGSRSVQEAHGIQGGRFIADDSRILTWSADGTARVWDSSGKALTPPTKHDEPGRGLEVSPDEARVLTWSGDGTVRLWDSRTGQELFKHPLQHDRPVRGAQVSANRSRILTWTDDGTVRLWDGQTGADALGKPLGHDRPLLGAQISADGSCVVTWSWDDSARVWDGRTGEALTPALTHERPVRGARFDTDGTRIITWSLDGTLRVWDSRTGQALTPPMRHDAPVLGAQFSGDEKRILSWSLDGTARLWDSRTGEASLTRPLKPDRPVQGARFSPDSSRVLTWSEDGSARLWDSATGEESASQPLRHERPVRGARFSEHGTRILTWSEDGTARLWNADTGEMLALPLKHNRPLRGAQFDGPDGARILTWSDDGTARLWDTGTQALRPRRPDRDTRLKVDEDVPTGETAARPTMPHTLVRGAQFSKDDSRVLTWSDDGTARLWDTRTAQALTPPLAHDRAARGIQASPDGSRILAWSDDGTARLLDSRTMQAVLKEPIRHGSPIQGAQFSADGAQLLTWSNDGAARLWDSRTGADVVGRTLQHDSALRGALFSPDGSRMLTWGENKKARLWNARTGEDALGKQLEHAKSVLGAQFSADGARILTWSWDGTAHLWDSSTGRKALPSPLKHDKAVRGAQFSADGSRILTWTSDDTAWLWVSATGEPAAPPMPHESSIRGAQFGAGVTRVLTWNEDGTARLWDSRTGEAITPPLSADSPVRSAGFDADESGVWAQNEDGSARSWDISVDTAWPAQQVVLRTEVETGTKLTPTGQLRALDPAEWQRKRWCEYDATRHNLGRLSEADWTESQRLCRQVQGNTTASP